MVESITSSSSTATTNSTSKTGSNSLSASYEMFLQLLCTQLETQNPLDPMDSTQFTQQLATYAQLEQQISTNSKLDSVLGQFDSVSLSTGVGYIGREVEAATDTLAVSDDGSVDGTWKYSLDGKAASVKLTVVDEDGNTVWKGDGDGADGSHDFAWNGKTTAGKAVPAGDYTLKITATDANGKAVDSSIAIKGKVTAVDSSSGSAVLELGDTKVNLSSVTRLAA